jgi:hypothetical protein
VSKEKNSKKISLTFLIIFVIISAIVFAIPSESYASLMSIPQISITQTGNTLGGYPDLPIPNFSFSFTATFSALGSVSVDNSIDVTVAINYVNITDEFFKNYRGIGFEHAYNYPIAKGSEGIAVLPFVDNHNGTFTAHGRISWTVEGATYLIVIPRNYDLSVSNEQIERGTPILYVSGISDTLSITTAESAAKVTLLVATIGILTLEPIAQSFRRQN